MGLKTLKDILEPIKKVDLNLYKAQILCEQGLSMSDEKMKKIMARVKLGFSKKELKILSKVRVNLHKYRDTIDYKTELIKFHSSRIARLSKALEEDLE